MPSVNNDDEYIGIINKEYRNPKAIANLINYLAETYKIDNDIATKKSFAFRLTGRLRPKDDEFVRVIHWKTEDISKLFYICKKLYPYGPKGGGKYDKMKAFFIADKIPGFKTKGSSYAARAGSDFEDKMASWFPVENIYCNTK